MTMRMHSLTIVTPPFTKALRVRGRNATVTIEDPRKGPIEGPYAEIRGENPYAVPDSLHDASTGSKGFSAPVLPPRVSPSASDEETTGHNYVNQNKGKSFKRLFERKNIYI